MNRETVYEFGVQSGLLMKGQDFGFKFDEVMKFAAMVVAEKDKEIEGLRSAYNIVAEDCRNLTEKVIPNIRSERDAALGLLRELVETRDKHYVYQTNDVMPRWDERVAAALRRGEGER